MKRTIFVAIILLIFSTCLDSKSWAADEESVGQQAEQAGKLREAVTHYVAALQSVPEGSAKDQQLREKIIKLVQQLTPPPAVPEDVIRYEGRAEAAFKSAKSRDELLDASKEYSKALRLAPWIGINYFNLGVVLEKVGEYTGAIRNFRLYLLATPNAQDSVDVKKKIAGLEYAIEKATEAKNAEARKLAEQKASAEKLKGQWTVGRGYRNTWGTACKYSLPDPGHLFSIDVRGDQIQIYLVKSSFTNCVTNIRFPRYPLNLLKFRGTIQDGQITGTCYVHTYTQQAPNDVRDLKESDYYVSRSSSCKAEILWDGTGSSFTMSPNLMVQFGALPSNPYPLEWERE